MLHRRLDAIRRHYGVTFAELIKGGLHLMSFVGKDAVLATVTRSGKVEPTKLYQQLLEAAGDIKPKSITIASCANVFIGDENVRPQVQQFVGLLTRMAIIANGSIVLISHPSLAGINSDTGLSGSTQWHNAVRARFYIKGIKPESGEQPDDDLREIVFKKNQYGPKAESVALRYRDGMFLPLPSTSTLDKIAHDAKADELFLTLLQRLNDQNRGPFSHKKQSNNYAPKVFADTPEAKAAGISKAALADAMERLLNGKKIAVERYGPPSKDWAKLERKKQEESA